MATFLATGIFGLGDARYYSRVVVKDTVTNLQLETMFAKLELLSEAKLISITKSIFYDAGTVPAGDSSPEYRYKLLVRFPNRTKVIEIPCVTDRDTDIDTWFATNKAALLDEDGDGAVELVKIDTPPERKARGK